MKNTMALLEKALNKKTASAWARDLNITPGALTNAKQRGRLSPTLAGNLAINLGENAEHWIAIAAIEAEPASEQLERLKRHERAWLNTSIVTRLMHCIFGSNNRLNYSR